MKIYNLKQYAEKYHPTKSIRTVQRMCSSGLIPNNHALTKAHDYFIVVNDYYTACIEFHMKREEGGDDIMLAIVLSLKYGLDKHVLFNYLGIG